MSAFNGSTTLNVTRFVWTGSMNAPRMYQMVTLLNTGLVLIPGGGCWSAEIQREKGDST